MAEERPRRGDQRLAVINELAVVLGGISIWMAGTFVTELSPETDGVVHHTCEG